MLLNPNSPLIDYVMYDFSKKMTSDQRIAVRLDIDCYISAAFKAMPWSTWAPILVLSFLFRIAGFSFFLSSFKNQSHAKQAKFIKFWSSKGKPFDSFIRLYRSLVLLVIYEKYLDISYYQD